MTVTTDDTAMPMLADQAMSPIGTHVARLSAEFGDDAPRASRTRVLNMQGAAGLDEAATLALLDEAAAIARLQAPTITKRGRAGGVVRMPYLLATLRGLVEVTTDATVAAGQTAGAPLIVPSAAPYVPDANDPPVTTDAEVVWQAVLGEVRRDVTAENYAAWFVPTRAITLDGEVLRVTVPTPFHRQWLEHKLRGCVDRALGHTGHAGMRIAYDIVTLADRVSVANQATDQVTILDPAIVPRLPAFPRETPAAAPLPRPPAVSRAVPPLAVACPSCRAAPCRCRLTEQVRRVIAARAALIHAGAPGP